MADLIRKHILFYYTSNKRSVSLTTIMGQMVKEGYKVSLLTQTKEGLLHEDAKNVGVCVQGLDSRLSFVSKIQFLTSFCKRHKIDAVFSHLQQANIVAVFAQFFIEARVFIFRHHDYAVNFKEQLADQLINILSSRIIVPSSGLKNLMLRKERVCERKVNIIHYTYDFSTYPKVDRIFVAELRKKYSATLLAVIMARHIKEKQHELVFEAISNLVEKGCDIKLFVLDEGPLTNQLKSWVEERSLGSNVIFVGYSTTFLSYLAAADIMIHPSISEASNSAVKESAIVKTPVVVSKGVGDFDDYIRNKENGFVLSNQGTERRINEIKEIILFAIQNKAIISEFGEKLFLDVKTKFGTPVETAKQYHRLIQDGHA